MERQYNELKEKLSQPELLADQNNFRKVAKEHHGLEQIVTAFHDWQKVQEELAGAQKMLRDENDKEMREIGRARTEKIAKARRRIEPSR